MSLADAEKFGFDLSPIEPDRQGFTADGAALDFGKNEVTITCTYDFGQNNDSLNRVNLIIQLSEDYDGTTEDALWTIMNFYYKNIGTSPDVNEGTASCIWKTGQSTIELFLHVRQFRIVFHYLSPAGINDITRDDPFFRSASSIDALLHFCG